MLMTRGKGGWGRAEEGKGGINVDGRLDFGWWTHHTIYRRVTELYTWDLYNFTNQCHPNIFSLYVLREWAPVQKVSSRVIWNKTHLLKKIQDTRNTVHRTMMPQLPSKQAPWDLTQFSQSPSAAPSYFPESQWWSETCSLSKVILVLGKARICRAPNLSRRGAESLGDLMFCQKALHKTWCMGGGVVTMKLPVTSWPQLQPPESSEQFPQRNVQASCKTWCRFFVLLAHFECDSHTVHTLTRYHLLLPLTSTVKSSLFTHAHSSLLSLADRLHWCNTNHSPYINNGWIFLYRHHHMCKSFSWLCALCGPWITGHMTDSQLF